MVAGLRTISKFEYETYILPMIPWSYFRERPVTSVSLENLVDILRKHVTRLELRQQLGRAGKEYVGKYNRYHSASYLFTNVIDHVCERKDSVINLYYPLLGEYPNPSPKIQNPLVNNRIVD